MGQCDSCVPGLLMASPCLCQQKTQFSQSPHKGLTRIELGVVLQTWFVPLKTKNVEFTWLPCKLGVWLLWLLWLLFCSPSLFIIYYVPFFVFPALANVLESHTVFHRTWSSFIWRDWLSNQLSSCLYLLRAGVGMPHHAQTYMWVMGVLA